MAESTVVYTPDNNNGGSVPAWLAMQNGGWGNGMGGWGSGILGFILGALLGNGGFGNGGFGWGGGNGAAAALGAQATANNNTDLLMNAINGTDADVRLLATTLNSDVDSVRLAINTVQGALGTLSAQVGLSGQQIINAIQMGDTSLSRQLCECCCEMRQLTMEQGYQNQLRTVEQTNTLGSAIAGASQRNVDAIADLKTTMVQEFCNVKEREMQDKINSLTANNTLLRSQIDNANQTAQIAGLIAPIAKEVDDIKCKLPNTVSVNYPNLVAVSTTPNIGFGNGFGWGGFGGFGGGYGFGYGVPGGSYWG